MHLIKDCDDMEETNEAKFDEIEEKDISLGKSMNVFPLPK
jgi:hypothetical protein